MRAIRVFQARSAQTAFVLSRNSDRKTPISALVHRHGVGMRYAQLGSSAESLNGSKKRASCARWRFNRVPRWKWKMACQKE